VLTGRQVVLRELRASDAPSLLAMISPDEVSRFLSPAPPSLEAYERFIGWALRQRAEGAGACFAVTLKGFDTAIGLFQVRQLDSAFDVAEWGFAIGSPFWGTGVFADAAALVLNFVFGTIGVQRLEARAAARNGRGNGALLKMGAAQEGLLRQSLPRDGSRLDQILYAMTAGDWQRTSGPTADVAPGQIH
jgi:ribosomal-protein-alanine N-acetyltransferase